MKHIKEIDSNQSGIIHHLILFLVIGFVLGVTSFAGWRVWKNGQDTSAKAESNLIGANFKTNGNILTSQIKNRRIELLNFDVESGGFTSVFFQSPKDPDIPTNAYNAQYSYGGGSLFYEAVAKPIEGWVTDASIYRHNLKTQTKSQIFNYRARLFDHGSPIPTRIQSLCLTANRVVFSIPVNINNELEYEVYSTKLDGSNKIRLVGTPDSTSAGIERIVDVACGDDNIYIAALHDQQRVIFKLSDKNVSEAKNILSTGVDYESQVTFCGVQQQTDDRLVVFDETLSSGSNETSLKVYNSTTKTSTRLSHLFDSPEACAVSPDGKQVVVDINGVMTLFDLKSGKMVRKLTPSQNKATISSWMAVKN